MFGKLGDVGSQSTVSGPRAHVSISMAIVTLCVLRYNSLILSILELLLGTERVFQTYSCLTQHLTELAVEVPSFEALISLIQLVL